MTDTPGPDPDLDDAPQLKRLLETLPASAGEISEELDVAYTTVENYRNRIQDTHGIPLEYDSGANEWRRGDGEDDTTDEPDLPDLPDLSDVEAGDEPDPSDLTEREEYLVGELQTGATVDGLADDIGTRPSVVTQHLRDLKRQGWQVYIDESAGHVAIEGDHLLRSSEHKGTRTRKANRWWELRHNELVREFKRLQTPDAELDATAGHEDWVTHLTDLHAGDRVRRDDGTVVYETAEVPDVIDYLTEQSLSLAEKHNSTYDAAHLLWGGDMVTNEGIYEGQFEDLDAWLDEQHDALVAPLVRQLKAFSERFPTVQVVCQVGNPARATPPPAGRDERAEKGVAGDPPGARLPRRLPGPSSRRRAHPVGRPADPLLPIPEARRRVRRTPGRVGRRWRAGRGDRPRRLASTSPKACSRGRRARGCSRAHSTTRPTSPSRRSPASGTPRSRWPDARQGTHS